MDEKYTRLIETDEVAPDEGRRVRIDGLEPIAVFNVDGEFFVTQDTCSHAKASLSKGSRSAARCMTAGSTCARAPRSAFRLPTPSGPIRQRCMRAPCGPTFPRLLPRSGRRCAHGREIEAAATLRYQYGRQSRRIPDPPQSEAE